MAKKFEWTKWLSILALVIIVIDAFAQPSFIYGDFVLTGTSLAVILIAIVNVIVFAKK